MKLKPLFLGALSALALLAGCATDSATKAPPPLLLISLDGFRWDYCALHPAETPHLRRLQAEGCSARALIPVYPPTPFRITTRS